MKEIKNLRSQKIHLDGFGWIEISESEDGYWHLDLTPPFSENELKNLRIGYKADFQFTNHIFYKAVAVERSEDEQAQSLTLREKNKYEQNPTMGKRV